MAAFATRTLYPVSKGLALRVGPVAILFLLGHVLGMSGIVLW